jgi:tRNA A-37 threonylcarbamoyl transferase component Bud32
MAIKYWIKIQTKRTDKKLPLLHVARDMGYETSLILARNGFHTYATMRKLEGDGSKQIIATAKNENLPLQARWR